MSLGLDDAEVQAEGTRVTGPSLERFALKQVDLPAFQADPTGHCFIRPGWLVWRAPGPWAGGITYGPVGLADEPILRAAYSALLRAGDTPLRFLADASRARLTSIDPRVWAANARGNALLKELIEERVERYVMLVPDNPLGLVAAGIVRLARAQRVETTVVWNRAEAHDWLGGAHELGLIEAELNRLCPALTSLPDLVLRLRGLLAKEPRLPIEEVARRLGTSVRTLQRSLTRSGTTFGRCQDEATIAWYRRP